MGPVAPRNEKENHLLLHWPLMDARHASFAHSIPPGGFSLYFSAPFWCAEICLVCGVYSPTKNPNKRQKKGTGRPPFYFVAIRLLAGFFFVIFLSKDIELSSFFLFLSRFTFCSLLVYSRALMARSHHINNKRPQDPVRASKRSVITYFQFVTIVSVYVLSHTLLKSQCGTIFCFATRTRFVLRKE